MNEKEILDALHWRYATKQFDTTKKIAPHDLQMLKEAVRLSASSFGLQPWRVVHVKEPALRAKLAEAAWNQPQITQASEVFVFAAITTLSSKYVEDYIHLVASTHSLPAESLDGYKNMMLGFEQGLSPEHKITWAQKQAYIALGNLLTTTALLKIDACPMEGFDAPQVDKVLGLEKDGLTTAVICTLGYRSPEDKTASYKKVRFPIETLFIEK